MNGGLDLKMVIGTAVGVFSSCIAVTAYAFNTFEQKSSFEIRRAEINNRLDRIEDKIDRLVNFQLGEHSTMKSQLREKLLKSR